MKVVAYAKVWAHKVRGCKLGGTLCQTSQALLGHPSHPSYSSTYMVRVVLGNRRLLPLEL